MFHLCPGGLDTVAGCLVPLTSGSVVLSPESWYPVFNPLLHFVFEGVKTLPVPTLTFSSSIPTRNSLEKSMTDWRGGGPLLIGTPS